jgi:two-component system response regulator AtoC
MTSPNDKTGGKTASLSHALTAAGALSDGGVSLVVYHRDGAAAATLRPGQELVVGRVPPADLVVPDHSLSRQHARFWMEDDVVHIADMGSTNGTWVDGESIETATVPRGGVVTLGTASAVVQSLANRPRMGLDGHDQFVVTLERELTRSRFYGRPLSLMMVRSRERAVHVSCWLENVRELLRPVDRVALYSSDTLDVLLHEADVEPARALAAKLSVGDDDLAIAICSFPIAATTADRLVERCLRELRQSVTTGDVRVAAASAAMLVGQPSSDMVAESKAMKDTLTMAKRLARGSIPVLLYGETGTGKEVLSRFIHGHGPRKDKPMVAVNCAAIPPQLVEATLFGHEKGAFTGATAAKKGVFEAAHEGTVLLDEIGELPPEAQAAMLRVLETKKITRVGSTKEIEVDVRIMAATHRDLEEMSRRGTFREDLLYRLNALTLQIPPLRDRRDAIAALANRFLLQANESNGRAITGFEQDALDALRRYAWPGNVRELRNTIDRAVVIAEHDVISLVDLPRRIEEGVPQSVLPSAPSESLTELAAPTDKSALHRQTAESFRECMERLEAEVIVEALREADGNQTEAARMLSMPRRTLVHKIKVLGIKKLGYGVGNG